jgi:hypothetical protein
MTAFVERAPLMEQRLGVSFAGLYAYGDDQYVHVNGEMRSSAGDQLSQDVEIVVNLYDAGGRMLGTMNEYVKADAFFGFESFSLSEDLEEDQAQVTRILVVAKKW